MVRPGDKNVLNLGVGSTCKYDRVWDNLKC